MVDPARGTELLLNLQAPDSGKPHTVEDQPSPRLETVSKLINELVPPVVRNVPGRIAQDSIEGSRTDWQVEHIALNVSSDGAPLLLVELLQV